MQYGGVPFLIQLDRRKKTKPQVMVLCDISDSVLNASRFMLQFVYSVQDLYAKVRSFVFVAEIGEVTKLFEEHDIQTAVETALKGDVIDVYSHSNFGRAFEQFHRNFFAAVTSKTTVLIIGDGRNNYNRPNDWVLREVKQKAKQLIWLNPESRMTWGIGDSEMPRYAPHCHIAEECRSINQLYKIVDLIVPMKKLYIQTYGCQMNQYDSEQIAQVLARRDYVQTDRIDNADVILLNTCSVRDKAEQKVYSALGSWKEFKDYRDGVIIGVGGCVAQQEGENLLKRVPHLDLVFGTHNIHKLPEMIEQVENSRARPVETAFYRDPAYMDDGELRTQVDGVKAFVTIMQGCNKVCSFCIVPHVRGREVSRPSGKILAEIESLARQGVKEVMLLGQNVNSYGKLTPGEVSFAELFAGSTRSTACAVSASPRLTRRICRRN